MGAMMLGATASTLSMFTDPLLAKMPEFDAAGMSDATAWFENIKGEHRVVFDGSMPHHGFPVIWNWAYLLSQNQTGVEDGNATAMTVLRHNAIPFALHSDLWAKYPFGELFEIHMADGSPYTRNPYYEPQQGDFPLPVVQGIKELIGRGSMFCVCDLALNFYSGQMAAKTGQPAEAIYAEWKAGVLPDIQVVPSGVWALGMAQHKGCGYIFAGE